MCKFQTRISQQQAPQTPNVHKGILSKSKSLDRLTELWDRECCLNNSWGGKPSESPAAPPTGAALLSPAQGGILDGFPWEIPDRGIRQPND